MHYIDRLLVGLLLVDSLLILLSMLILILSMIMIMMIVMKVMRSNYDIILHIKTDNSLISCLQIDNYIKNLRIIECHNNNLCSNVQSLESKVPGDEQEIIIWSIRMLIFSVKILTLGRITLGRIITFGRNLLLQFLKRVGLLYQL